MKKVKIIEKRRKNEKKGEKSEKIYRNCYIGVKSNEKVKNVL